MSQLPGPEDARAIHEDLLERTQAGVLEGDFALYAACFLLPLHLTTLNGRREIATEADLRAVFDRVRARNVRLNVTHFVRNCLSASFVDPDTIRAAHETRLISGTHLLGPAVPALSLLRRVDGAWKVSDQEFARDDTHGRTLFPLRPGQGA